MQSPIIDVVQQCIIHAMEPGQALHLLYQSYDLEEGFMMVSPHETYLQVLYIMKSTGSIPETLKEDKGRCSAQVFAEGTLHQLWYCQIYARNHRKFLKPSCLQTSKTYTS